MASLNNLKIVNFRGFDDLEVEGLSKINLFVGKNNSGKTSILEALLLLLGMSNPMLPYHINQFRGLGAGTPFGSANSLKYLFHNLSLKDKPAFKARFSDNTERYLELEAEYQQNKFPENNSSVLTPEEISGITLRFKDGQSSEWHKSSITFGHDGVVTPHFSTRYEENLYAVFVTDKSDSATLSRFSEIVKRKGENSILQVLQEFDENIVGVQPLADGIFFDLKDVEELIPSNIMGGGVKRFLNIVTAVAEKKDAFVCIDEIENGLHYSSYALLWKSLLTFSEQNNVQLFITTHNIETLACLKSVLEDGAFQSMQEHTKVFDVLKTKIAGNKTYRYSFEGFQEAIDREFELRR